MTIFRWFWSEGRIHGAVPGALTMPTAREASPLDLDEIHARHADFVWRSLQRLGVRPADLEDALQEVFIVVHRRLASFEHSARVTTWLFGICLRVAVAHNRRAHVRRERTAAAPDWLENELSPDVPSPEHAALEREGQAELEALLDQLDPVKRATVVMFELEGMTAPEIAIVTDVPISTVYSRLATARETLKRAAERARRRERSSIGTKGER
jgi:RNA polymerase sigma-70 factor (ECF subfamily)